MRLFLALNLPAELQASLHEATAPLRSAAPSVTWVRAENLHLTVKFLGEQPDAAAAALAGALTPVAAAHPPPLLEIGRVGAFPRLRRPRVVWLAVRPDPRLELLHHDVETACAALGYPVEGRPFRPHLTLGRVAREPFPDAAALGEAARLVQLRVGELVGTLDLMHSTLAPGGSRYVPLAQLPFSPRG